jgi:hypothetical protein
MTRPEVISWERAGFAQDHDFRGPHCRDSTPRDLVDGLTLAMDRAEAFERLQIRVPSFPSCNAVRKRPAFTA